MGKWGMKEVWVIGAGTMGNGISHVFALAGWNVLLIDVSEEQLKKALQTISTNMDRQIKKGLISEGDKAQAMARIRTATQISEGEPDIVIEAVFENYEVKRDVLARVSNSVPQSTIIGSNTSSISITKLGACVRHRERFLGIHFMNPVPVMKLVEVIAGLDTAPDVINKSIEIVKELGKTPVCVNDYPGFVSNRILLPMINEAIYALDGGVAGVEEIDTVMKLGMNHPMGPLQLADFIGLDVCLNILNVLYEGFKNDKYAPCPLLEKLVVSGHLGVKTGSGFYVYEGVKIVGVAPYIRKL